MIVDRQSLKLLSIGKSGRERYPSRNIPCSENMGDPIIYMIVSRWVQYGLLDTRYCTDSANARSTTRCTATVMVLTDRPTATFHDYCSWRLVLARGKSAVLCLCCQYPGEDFCNSLSPHSIHLPHTCQI